MPLLFDQGPTKFTPVKKDIVEKCNSCLVSSVGITESGKTKSKVSYANFGVKPVLKGTLSCCDRVDWVGVCVCVCVFGGGAMK